MSESGWSGSPYCFSTVILGYLENIPFFVLSLMYAADDPLIKDNKGPFRIYNLGVEVLTRTAGQKLIYPPLKTLKNTAGFYYPPKNASRIFLKF